MYRGKCSLNFINLKFEKNIYTLETAVELANFMSSGELKYNIFIYLHSFRLADLLHCTNEPNVSIPQLANLLIERTTNGSWIVVFKSLVTVHHLMCYGNERFTQYLASSNCTFNLSSFNDRLGTPQVSEGRTLLKV